MADKGSTWFNGAGAITGAEPGVGPSSVRPNGIHPYPVDRYSGGSGLRGGRTGTILIVAALAACSALLLMYTPTDWTWELLRIMGVVLLLMSAFYFPLQAPKPAFVIWWVMLIGECIFFREGDANSHTNAYAGQFPTAA